MSYYQHHFFCCTNERPEGHSRGSCARGGAEELQKYLKARLKELALQHPDLLGRVRANKSGCLDRCEEGPILVIYPEGVWYHYRSREDIDEILQAHLLEGRNVQRLRR